MFVGSMDSCGQWCGAGLLMGGGKTEDRAKVVATRSKYKKQLIAFTINKIWIHICRAILEHKPLQTNSRTQFEWLVEGFLRRRILDSWLRSEFLSVRSFTFFINSSHRPLAQKDGQRTVKEDFPPYLNAQQFTIVAWN